MLTALITALAIAVFQLEIAGLDRLSPGGTQVPWYVLALGFAVVEANVVHLHFRGRSFSFALGGIMLVVGLFFVAPAGLIAAQLLGAAIVLTIKLRRAPTKIVHHLAARTLGAALAVVVFRALTFATTPVAPASWAAVLGAAVVAAAVGFACHVVASVFGERPLALEGLMQSGGFALFAAAANTMMGLIVAIVCWRSLGAGALLIGPILVLFVAYRAYISERSKSEGLQFLYGASQLLNGADDLEDGLVALLNFARETFHAELAEIVLLAGDDDTSGFRSASGPGHATTRMIAVARDDVDPLIAACASGRTVLIEPDSSLKLPLRNGFETASAMLAPLRGGSGLRGATLVACGPGTSGSFGPDQQRLFETFANHLSTTLDKSQLSTSLSELRALKQELTYQATHDSLTGLANRALFRDQVDEALIASAEDGGGTMVLFIDLDDFKTVNDTMGHAAGDALLEVVASRITAAIGEHHMAARLGGDEFAVLLRDVAHDADARRIADAILVALGDPIDIGGHPVVTQASIGIASHAGARDAAELMQNADVAMYTAKRNGKGRFDVFESTMSLSVARRHQVKVGLERALAADELLLQYQPVVDAATRKVVACEALVRWREPTRGLLPPSEFISIAEETGMIMPIGRYVLDEACKHAARWSPTAPDFKIFVNLSIRQLADDGLLDDVRAALRKHGVCAEQLVLEVTESAMMQDIDGARVALLALKELGAGIAIDDFGTGFSSLSYLRQLPIDVLKVARPFIDTVGQSASDTAFVRGIIELGHVVGAQVLAQGVERPDQLAHLVDMGCDFVQGYYYAHSLDPDEFEALLHSGTAHLDELRSRETAPHAL